MERCLRFKDSVQFKIFHLNKPSTWDGLIQTKLLLKLKARQCDSSECHKNTENRYINYKIKRRGDEVKTKAIY